jgi:transposase-like protein
MSTDQAELMQLGPFQRLKAEVAAASAAQILELEDVIQHVVTQQCVDVALARRTRTTTENPTCPHCKSHTVVRHGKDQNQRQRFKCRACGRTHNILTGTAMARARKPEKWRSYLGFMTDHTSIRAIRQTGIGLNHVTIWRWRHRFLTAAAHDNTAVLRGIIEVDVTLFRRSCKGSRRPPTATQPEPSAAGSQVRRTNRRGFSDEPVPVLSALDSSGGMFQTILSSLSDIETVLPGRIAAGSVLCAKDQAVYARVADQAKAEPYLIQGARKLPDSGKANPVATPGWVRGRLGLGRVDHHHRHLRHLIEERCRGVATKYLGRYLGWHRAMVRPGFAGTALLTRALASCSGVMLPDRRMGFGSASDPKRVAHASMVA